jgi:hypothetical protein
MASVVVQASCCELLLAQCALVCTQPYIPTSGTARGTGVPALSAPGCPPTASCCEQPAQAQSLAALRWRPYFTRLGYRGGEEEEEDGARRRGTAGYNLCGVHLPRACQTGDQKGYQVISSIGCYCCCCHCRLESCLGMAEKSHPWSHSKVQVPRLARHLPAKASLKCSPCADIDKQLTSDHPSAATTSSTRSSSTISHFPHSKQLLQNDWTWWCVLYTTSFGDGPQLTCPRPWWR